MALKRAQTSLQQGKTTQEEAQALVEESRDILALTLDAKVISLLLYSTQIDPYAHQLRL